MTSYSHVVSTWSLFWNIVISNTVYGKWLNIKFLYGENNFQRTDMKLGGRYKTVTIVNMMT